ncbi:MAG: hypothetical protein ACI8RD_014210, partial [Bacillariaceae sp.]
HIIYYMLKATILPDPTTRNQLNCWITSDLSPTEI